MKIVERRKTLLSSISFVVSIIAEYDRVCGADPELCRRQATESAEQSGFRGIEEDGQILVPEISLSRFDTLINQNEPWIIYYYLPTCRACTLTTPIIYKFKKQLPDDFPVHVGMANCSGKRSVCSRLPPIVYPSIHFHLGQHGFPFEDTITVESLMAFAQQSKAELMERD
ncbi:hypothetical protein BLNAU_544 [Blattamonas nauphoetae]|uniref:Thioredoxin domain-containing protein n=1 Tax=Blattamonas nauphoetae TaxID=2049346 RepID=A0ABQ9YLK2_9EUKA|nr:hypothetical protein BLNAU_544 [Blattamonas nauphoetae]